MLIVAGQTVMRNERFFDKLRRWIDGEEAILEGAPLQVQSKWNNFFIAVARELSDTLEGEMFTPPDSPTYIPPRFWIFLNPEDDAEWQGEKRRGLERGLQQILLERAQSLAGESGLQHDTLTVELHVDEAIEKGRFRIQPIWDDRSDPTQITTRRSKSGKNRRLPFDEDLDDETIVRPRKPCFTLSARRLGDEAKSDTTVNHPFHKNEIILGRGSAKSSIEVDLRLSGDMEISRVHARLKKISADTFQLSCVGANPILLNHARELAKGQSIKITTTDKITIGSYELAIEEDLIPGEEIV